MNELETTPSKILIIDDEVFVRNILNDILCEDYDCETAASAEEALEMLAGNEYDLVLSDIRMKGMSGIELIPKVLERAPDTVVMTISGEASIDSAIQAIQAGTFDYIKKPFEIEAVKISVDRALKHRMLLVQKRRYENHLEELVEKRTRQLNYLAFYDSLTKLPNRTLFEDRFAQSLQAADRNGKQVALIFLTLDRFKKIQETLGHNSGFTLLRVVAERLQSSVPVGTTVARFENDEFAIVLPVTESKEVVDQIEKLKESIKAPVKIDGHELFISACFGISVFKDDGADVETLQKHAAVALARAREQGEDGCQFFAEEMNSAALRLLDLEVKLRHALERGEFQVYYQPKKDFTDGSIVGMEALVRWNHPDLGIVSPGEFIPLAEETGLIIPIGEWILRTACRETKALHDRGLKLRVSVNLSTRQLQEQCVAGKVRRILEETRIDPNYLELEVTESALLHNAETAIKILNDIKDAGVRISIDDFGTGYSSFAYLKRLPIDVLKIDKSFVKDITHDPNDASLVMAIISLAHNLRLKVIAEGVETAGQLQLLHLLRCDEWQGFLFSKPVPYDNFCELVESSLASVR